MWIDTKQLTCPNEYLINQKFRIPLSARHFSHLSFHFSGSAPALGLEFRLYYGMRFSDKVFTLTTTQTATNLECTWCSEHGSWLDWLYIRVPSLGLGLPFSFLFYTHRQRKCSPQLVQAPLLAAFSSSDALSPEVSQNFS